MPPTALLPIIPLPARSQKRARALTPEQVFDLRKAFQAGEQIRDLATKYGIGKSAAHRAATGQSYTDVATPARIEWTAPKVRSYGFHSDSECRQIGAMLRQHPGTWALVKKTKTKPDAKHYESFGMEASVIQLGSEWGLYVRWAAA